MGNTIHISITIMLWERNVGRSISSHSPFEASFEAEVGLG